ncbi:polyubiquitin-like [Phragmites australis]|uniref:polyubiquitin-like n=1 Tax=Phragmites australis TaxID=29695 RepID=UPI002D765AD9|nr:polyubiquitin-like [Phragmites australis]
MDVTFETPGGLQFTVEVWYFATVREMKEAVCRREGIPVASQRLFFDGRELDDGRDATYYSILQGSRVLLLHDETPYPAASSASVRVIVDSLAVWRLIEIDLRASDTVARLKELLQERTGGLLRAARTALFFDREEMEDGKTLSEYDPPEYGMEVCAQMV